MPLEELQPRSVALAANGIKTSGDLANLMSTVMCDVAVGNITPRFANTITKEAGKVLKQIEKAARMGGRKGGDDAG